MNSWARGQRGFSMIEIMLGLAIFGLIIGIVWLAVPQATRARRDNERRADLQRVADNLEKLRASFDNAHQYPEPGSTQSGCSRPQMFVCFFDPSATGTNAGKYAIPSGNDLLSNQPYRYHQNGGPLLIPTATRSADIVYESGNPCGANGTPNRQVFRLTTRLESGAEFCIDNH